MKRYRMLIVLGLLTSVFGCAAGAPEIGRAYRLGYLTSEGTSAPPALVQALRELGYVEGRTLAIESRPTTEGAAELAHINVDIIVVEGLASSLAAKKASSSIPIVAMTASDPVAAGLVASLAQPGGNLTGIIRAGAEPAANPAREWVFGEVGAASRRLALLKEILPNFSRLGVFRSAAASLNDKSGYLSMAAVANKIEIQYLDLDGANTNLNALIKGAAAAGIEALAIADALALGSQRMDIAELAIKHKLAVVSDRADDVAGGALFSYGWPEEDLFRRVAIYVDKILKGAKPANLRMENWPCVLLTSTPKGQPPSPTAPYNCEQPTRAEAVINLKTANQLGVTIPRNILAGADRVIR